MIKRALIGIVFMQIIILHRSYVVKQNESVVFLKVKPMLLFWKFETEQVSKRVKKKYIICFS